MSTTVDIIRLQDTVGLNKGDHDWQF